MGRRVHTGPRPDGLRMGVSRMRLKVPGPGYMHLPDWVEDEYIAQLTSEKAIRKYVRGRGAVREWIKTRERNEAFDLEVYALAALRTRGANYLRKALQAPVAVEKSITGHPTAAPEPPAEAKQEPTHHHPRKQKVDQPRPVAKKSSWGRAGIRPRPWGR